MSALEEFNGVHLIPWTTDAFALTKVGEQFAQESDAGKSKEVSEPARAVVQAVRVSPGDVRISAPVFMAKRGWERSSAIYCPLAAGKCVQLRRAINRPVDMIAEGIDIALSVVWGIAGISLVAL